MTTTEPAAKAGEKKGTGAAGDAGAKRPWTVNADGSVTVALKKPIETHDGTKRELTIREPEADLFFRYGLPFEQTSNVDGEGIVRSVSHEVKGAVVLKYLAAGTGLDEGILGTMSPFDAVRCGNAMIAAFFNDAGN